MPNHRIITIEQARVLGLSKYNTGEPCSRGHIAQRYTRNSTCVECQKLGNTKAREQTESASVVKRLTTSKALPNRSMNNIRRKMTEEEESAAKRARYHLGRLRIQLKTGKPFHYDYEVSENILGYTYQELFRHLNKQRSSYGDRHNQGRWHIDHIIPVAELVRRGVREPSIINDLENLQLLTVRQNSKKRDKLHKTSEIEIDQFIATKTLTYKSRMLWSSQAAKKIIAVFTSAGLEIDWNLKVFEYACAWYFERQSELQFGDFNTVLNFSLDGLEGKRQWSYTERHRFQKLCREILKSYQPIIDGIIRYGQGKKLSEPGSRSEINMLKNLVEKQCWSANSRLLQLRVSEAMAVRAKKSFAWRALH